MRILFCIRHSWYFRNVETTLLELLRRGHEITLVISNDLIIDEQTDESIRRFDREHQGLTILRHRERGDWWIGAVNTVRSATDLLHLRGEKFAGKTRMQKRPWKRASPIVRFAIERASRTRFRPVVERSLKKLDGSIPPERKTEKLFRSIRPDVAVFTPLIDLGCNQNELLRAATAQGIPTVLMVHSWDNLSTKSRLRTWPTRMIVWNEIQRREAEFFHGYPADRVAISGAPHFDQWLAMRPKRSREEFLASLGLDPTKPLILYLCSALFNDAPEPEFFTRWARAIRSHGDPLLASANILVRVHPKRIAELSQYELAELGNVVAWPKSSINPVGNEAKDNYVSSLTYADAMMAINTTAMIEAALLDKPVFTLLGTEHEISQTGTHHFNYLLNEGKGLLRATHSMDEHVEWLRRTIAGEEPFTETERSFVDMFARPHGRGVSGTSVLCNEIEAVTTAPATAGLRAEPVHIGWQIAAFSLAASLPPLLFTERAARRAYFAGARALSYAKRQAQDHLKTSRRQSLDLATSSSSTRSTESGLQPCPAETSR